MSARYLEILVEELSMEGFLKELLPRFLPNDCIFRIHPSQGKQDLLKNLAGRLKGYSHWLPDNYRLIVVVDCDNEDCHKLKEKLENAAAQANLPTRSNPSHRTWKLVNRIAIEELEAWYFGDWQAVRSIYTNVSPTIPDKAQYRDPDAIRGTWEAFEKILQDKGYFKNGIRKMEIARAMGAHVDPSRNLSPSFKKFYEAILDATT